MATIPITQACATCGRAFTEHVTIPPPPGVRLGGKSSGGVSVGASLDFNAVERFERERLEAMERVARDANACRHGIVVAP